jgi:hypothetical protein
MEVDIDEIGTWTSKDASLRQQAVAKADTRRKAKKFRAIIT